MDGFSRKALELKISSGAKLVYLAIAQRCGAKADCWQKVVTICQMTGLSRATVFRKLRELEDAGIIARKAKYLRGRQIENGFTILPSTGETGAVSNRDTEEDKPEEDNNILIFPVSKVEENKKEVLSSQTGEVKKQQPAQRERQFQEFWAAYPKQEFKPFAREQFFRAINRVPFETIMGGVDLLKRNCRIEGRDYWFYPSAERWLMGDGWENQAA